MANHEKRMVPLVHGDGLPLLSKKIGRNERCSCGSGKKAKNCHGVETKYFKTEHPKNSDAIRYIKE